MKKISKNDLVVYVFFFIISFCKGIGMNNSNKIYLIMYISGIAIATFKLFKVGFTKKELFIILSINVIGILDFILGKETTILFTGITLIFLKKTNIENVVKSLFFGRIIGFLLMIFLPFLGAIDMNTVQFYRNGGFVLRYAFGYSHPNLAHSTFNIIVIMWVYLYYEKINIYNIILGEALNFILYKFTLSRTGFIIMAIFLIITYISKKKKNIQNKLPKYLNLILFMSIVVGIICSLGYGKFAFMSKLDRILTGRIKYLSILVHSYLPPLIKYKNYTGILFDNGYFDLIYNGGILATIWFLKQQINTNKFLKKNNMYKESLITMSLLIYSITESYYANSIINIGILFFAYVIYENSYISNGTKENEKIRNI